MPIQIQIKEIQNGMLVVGPPESQARFKGQEPQQTEPSLTYCADYEELCEYLKKFFPPKISS